MGTKMAPAYAIIFMGNLEEKALNRTTPTPIMWKRYIDDICLVWTNTKESLLEFINSLSTRASSSHPRCPRMSDSQIDFLDVCLYKGERFKNKGIMDIKTYIKPANTQQYVHASSSYPPGTSKGLIKENSYDISEQTPIETHSELF